MRKSEAALLLESRIGHYFDAIVTGSSPYGVRVRVLTPLPRGKLVNSSAEQRVGDTVRVKLIGTNVKRGFIDFVATD